MVLAACRSRSTTATACRLRFRLAFPSCVRGPQPPVVRAACPVARVSFSAQPPEPPTRVASPLPPSRPPPAPIARSLPSAPIARSVPSALLVLCLPAPSALPVPSPPAPSAPPVPSPPVPSAPPVPSPPAPPVPCLPAQVRAACAVPRSPCRPRLCRPCRSPPMPPASPVPPARRVPTARPPRPAPPGEAACRSFAKISPSQDLSPCCCFAPPRRCAARYAAVWPPCRRTARCAAVRPPCHCAWCARGSVVARCAAVPS